MCRAPVFHVFCSPPKRAMCFPQKSAALGRFCFFAREARWLRPRPRTRDRSFPRRRKTPKSIWVCLEVNLAGAQQGMRE